jgi:hypothetical protein
LIAPLIEEEDLAVVVVSTPRVPRCDDPMILVVAILMAFCVIVIFIF